MDIRVTQASSTIDGYSIEAVHKTATVCKSLCITWNADSSGTIGPLTGTTPLTAPTLSSAVFERIAGKVFEAHLVVSESIFGAIVAALNSCAITFTVTHNSSTFTCTCGAPVMDGEPAWHFIAEAALATGEKVQAIEGHLSAIKDMLQAYLGQNPPMPRPATDVVRRTTVQS